MIEREFSDGISSITVIGGTVRVDFSVFSTSERDGNGQPKIVPSRQIVMTIDGFVRSAEKVREAVQALSDAGAVPRGASEPRIAPLKTAEAKIVKPASQSVSSPPKQPFP